MCKKLFREKLIFSTAWKVAKVRPYNSQKKSMRAIFKLPAFN